MSSYNFSRVWGQRHVQSHRTTDSITAVGWDDLRIDVTAGTKGNLNPPDLATFRDGLVLTAFADNATEQVYFDVQMPHSWNKTAIRPHIHWSPGNSTGTGSVVWGLEYSWANPVAEPGNVFPASTTLSVTQAADGVAYKHQIAQWSEIDATGKRESSVLVCRFFRDGGNVADTFTGDAFAVSLDFHYQSQGFGSTDEFPEAP